MGFTMKKNGSDKKHPFCISLLGEADNFIVVPAPRLKAELKNYVAGRRHADNGIFHFNLSLGKPTFEQLPDWNLRQYAANMELVPKISN
jgi:hypothetical protein